MTCRATYANRPRTRADERKTSQLVELPTVAIARTSYRKGLEQGQKLAEQASNRVRWTVTIIARDAWMFGVALGLLAGVVVGHVLHL